MVKASDSKSDLERVVGSSPAVDEQAQFLVSSFAHTGCVGQRNDLLTYGCTGASVLFFLSADEQYYFGQHPTPVLWTALQVNMPKLMSWTI